MIPTHELQHEGPAIVGERFQLFPDALKPSATGSQVAKAVRQAAELCRVTQDGKLDEAVEYELRQLNVIEEKVLDHWPLSEDVKRRIDLGPFAAKNIADWNTSLATVLMTLDYVLQHDGDGLDSIYSLPTFALNDSGLAPNAAPDDPLFDEATKSFDQILSQFEKTHSRRTLDESGQRSAQISGTVVSITADAVLVDIGYKTEGTLPLSLFGSEPPAIGDKLLVTSKGRNEEGYYDLSLQKVAVPKDITSLEEAFAAGSTIPGTVTAVVKGGLTVDVGVRAFMPASRSGVYSKEASELEKLVGQQIYCRIIKLEKEENESVDLVVDRRVVLEEEEKVTKEKRYAEMQEGDILNGTVRSLTDYGAFIDLGGVDGLLHISDLAWTRVASPSDVLALGQQLEVKVLKIDPATRKIGLGLKQLQPHPWDAVPATYTVGERITGTVTRLTDFGAFVELSPGVEGMIHVSEMSWAKKVRKPEDMLKLGETVEAVILAIDTAAQRIGLGLKQTLGDPWADAATRFPVGSTVTGPVSSLTKFGAFITLADGIEGMVHVSEILAEKRVERPMDVLRTGQIVQAKVLEVDSTKRQLKLSMKQLVPTGLDEYIAEHQPGDTVTARILKINPPDGNQAQVELGEGIYATCVLPATAPVEEAKPSGALDLSALTATLNAKWKGGPSAPKSKSEAPAAGQIRTFRITTIDPDSKTIAVELLP
jgi:small subunit ribosomal protein S1